MSEQPGAGQPGWQPPRPSSPPQSQPPQSQPPQSQPPQSQPSGPTPASGWVAPGAQPGPQPGHQSQWDQAQWGQAPATQQQWGQQQWGAPQPPPPVPKPGVVPLRPLGFGEILDGAFSSVQRYPKIILGLSSLVMAGVVLLTGLVLFLGFADMFTATAAELDRLSDSTYAAFGVTTLGLGLVVWIGGTILTGMITVTIARGVLGQPTTVAEVWQAVRGHVLRLLALTFVIALAAALAAIALVVLIIAGFAISVPVGVVVLVVFLPLYLFLLVFCTTRLVAATPALVLETRAVDPARPDGEHRRIGVFTALVRSWNLIKGRTPRTFGIVFVAGLIAEVVASIIMLAFIALALVLGMVLVDGSATAGGAIFAAGYGIGYVGALVLRLAFLSGVNALVYVDARMRAEGFDIVLAQATAPDLNAHGQRPDLAWAVR